VDEGEKGDGEVMGGVHLLPRTWLGGEVRKRRGSVEGYKIDMRPGCASRLSRRGAQEEWGEECCRFASKFQIPMGINV